jgi:hypothetical protein
VEDDELEQQGTDFICRFLASSEQKRAALRSAGADLAHQLRHEAIAMASSKATEFSPKIRLYHHLAAKVALLAYWPNTKPLAIYEKDIRYYRNFESTAPLVDDYESFRTGYVGKESSS